MKITKAVIPAAGMGTRFLPATKAQAKEMLPIVDKPSIQYIVEEAVRAGITDIMIITAHNKHIIEDHFDRSRELEEVLQRKGDLQNLEIIKEISSMANIYYTRQGECLGLGHSIYCAKNFVGNEPFAVLLGDDIVISETPSIKQLCAVYEKYNATILGVQPVSDDNINKYGIVDSTKISDSVSSVSDLVEKPSKEEAPSNLAILGRYVLTSQIFDMIEVTEADNKGEIQLTNALRKLLKHESIYAYEFSGKRYDIGNKFGFLEANIELGLNHLETKDQLRNYLKNLVTKL